MENKKSAVKDIVVKSVIADLREGELTWHKYWNMTNSPYNYETCHVYTGLNRLILATRDYEDPRYLTASQAEAVLGGHIDEDEQSIPLVWWHPIKVVEAGKKKTVPFMRYYPIYNVAQVKDIDIKPFMKSPQPRKSTAIKRAQEMVDNYPSPAPILIEESRETATFYPLTDSVHLPLVEQFKTEEGWWRALFHELAHTTGVEKESRLSRWQADKWFKDRGVNAYSKEELTAEITTAFLCAHCGIMGGFEEEDSKRIKGWLKVLKEDPHLVISAASHAEKAYQYIIGG